MTLHESTQLPRQSTIADIAAGEQACPVCSRDTQDEYVPLLSLPEDLAKLIRANAARYNWISGRLCPMCPLV